ncbi:MAG: amidohydrolase, partial [Candidatus Tectimicrobiota bacterium]
MPLIDCHIHAGDLTGLKPDVAEWVRSFQGDLSAYDEEGRLRAERLDRFLAAEGVDYALVLPEYSPQSVGLVPAEAVAALCGSSERLVPVGGVNPHLHDDPLAEVTRQHETLGVVAVKLHPVH